MPASTHFDHPSPGWSPVVTAEALCARGAIASLPGEPRPLLVGDFQEAGEGAFLIFTAFGDSPVDVHLLRYDEAIVNARGSLTLLADGHVVAALHHIEDADVNDIDDYRIAWQLWQEVAPLHRPLIERTYDKLLTRSPRRS